MTFNNIRGIINNFYVFFLVLFIISINTIFINNLILTFSSILCIIFIFFKLNKLSEVKKENILLTLFVGYILIRIPFSMGNFKMLIIDFLIYILFLLVQLISVKKMETFIPALKLIIHFGLLNFLFVILQFINPQFFKDLVINHFSLTEQVSIINLLSYNIYIGATNQPAHLAGIFLISAVIIIFDKKSQLLPRKMKFIYLAFFVIGLIFASKRAHIIFGLISLLILGIIILFSYRFSKKVYLYFSLSTFLAVFFFISLLKFYNRINIFSELLETIIGILKGTDVSNGRNLLYEYVISTYWNNPIIGNGWRFVSETSSGIISKNGSAAHNIYLQVMNEMGLIGLIVLVTFLSYNLYRTLNTCLVNRKNEYIFIGYIALFYQLFFIMYGFTGNVLTDYNYLLLYSFSILIINSLKIQRK